MTLSISLPFTVVFEILYLFTLSNYLGLMERLLPGVHPPGLLALWVPVNCGVNFIGRRDFLHPVTFPLK